MLFQLNQQHKFHTENEQKQNRNNNHDIFLI